VTMPRTARRVSPTGYYHIMMRGNNREKIFRNRDDKWFFLNFLRQLVRDQPVELAAYCIMNNHVHLLVKGELDVLSSLIKRLNLVFAMRYNQKYTRVGHVFQDRYKSQLITDEGYLLRCLRYIHNNPVKAQMVQKAEYYQFSSFHEYTKAAEVIHQNQRSLILGYFNHNQKSFRKYHGETDYDSYLDMPEEMKLDSVEKGKRMIEEALKGSGITILSQLADNQPLLQQLIKDLLSMTDLTGREIAELLGISYSVFRTLKMKSSLVGANND
jgi:REP element-mobilizing transposase RayT